VLLAAAISAGLLVHGLLPDNAVSDIAGDVLYALAVYAGIVMIAPRAAPVAVGGLALAWCVLVELFQLTGIPQRLGAAFSPAMLVLGTVFDARDLFVYAVVIIAVFATDRWLGCRYRDGRAVPSARHGRHPVP
jgi:hypothetical protein